MDGHRVGDGHRLPRRQRSRPGEVVGPLHELTGGSGRDGRVLVEGGVVEHAGEVVRDDGRAVGGEGAGAVVGRGDRVGDGVADPHRAGPGGDLLDPQPRQRRADRVARQSGLGHHPVRAAGRRVDGAAPPGIGAGRVGPLPDDVVDGAVTVGGEGHRVGDRDRGARRQRPDPDQLRVDEPDLARGGLDARVTAEGRVVEHRGEVVDHHRRPSIGVVAVALVGDGDPVFDGVTDLGGPDPRSRLVDGQRRQATADRVAGQAVRVDTVDALRWFRARGGGADATRGW